MVSCTYYFPPLNSRVLHVSWKVWELKNYHRCLILHSWQNALWNRSIESYLSMLFLTFQCTMLEHLKCNSTEIYPNQKHKMKSTHSNTTTSKIFISLPNNVIINKINVEIFFLSKFPFQCMTSFLCHSHSDLACRAGGGATDERNMKMHFFSFYVYRSRCARDWH